jgi:hypothetical protein
MYYVLQAMLKMVWGAVTHASLLAGSSLKLPTGQFLNGLTGAKFGEEPRIPSWKGWGWLNYKSL